jgi:hypothetical protein
VAVTFPTHFNGFDLNNLVKNFKQFVESAKPIGATRALALAVRFLTFGESLVVESGNAAVADVSVKVWQGTHPQSAAFFSWLNSIGVRAKVGMKLPNYADGGVGRAYFVGTPQIVVKFTSDANEFHIASKLSGDLHGPARVIGVHDLGVGLFVIAQEYAAVDENAPAKLKKAADYLQGGYIDEHPEVETNGLPRDEHTKHAIAASLAKKYGNSDLEIVAYIVKLIDVLNALFDKTGFLHDDAGMSNVGVAQDGQVIISDLGPNRNNQIDPDARQAKFAANLSRLGKS